MEFHPINRTNTNNQNIRIFDSIRYDIDGDFLLDPNGNLKSVSLNIINEHGNRHELSSALICCGKIKNNQKFYLLTINMKYTQSTINHNKVVVIPDECNVKFESGSILFVNIYEYEKDSQELKKCSDIDLFNMSLNPKHKNGNIIVGQP